jgi:hypothetical protein
MVNMGMGQQDGSNRFWIEAQISILTKRFVPAPLKEPAIEQQPKAWHLKYVAAACHRTRGSME